jgi:hypothetical protein
MNLTASRMSDNLISKLATELYNNHGFGGLIGFHFYNEPMRSASRMHLLIMMIKVGVPNARFLLWSNAAEHVKLNDFPYNLFERIYLSLYKEHSKDVIEKAIDNVSKKNTNIHVHPQTDDLRINPPVRMNGLCRRPYLEMDIDFAGDVRLCCHDWEGPSIVGNVVTEPLADVVAAWQATRAEIAHNDLNDRCKKCAFRYPVNVIDKEIWARAKVHAKEVKHANA